ncbi:polysaccharide deacetylase family protein [Niabella insulamsoli]|uniref:polysaccharide deacetylase family protein n=1 Tax=Niabella insulamsoli TaxID=3144874 RepID=UPI0031FBA6BA
MNHLLTIVCFVFWSALPVAAQQTHGFAVAKFRHDKACAISYTFDDGLKEHYTLVYPRLMALGFKATFWINGSKINSDAAPSKDTTRMDWGELKEMANQGQEISNHGWAHKNFGRFPLAEIAVDISKNDSAIYAHTGVMPRTFCYPNNTKTPEGVKLASQNRVGTRLSQRSVGGKSTDENLRKWADELIKNGEWGVTMTHGISYGYDHFATPQILWRHLNDVKSREDEIWISTFREVVSYQKERDSLQYEVSDRKNGFVVHLKSSLDKTLFTAPLTGVIANAGGRPVQIKQGGSKIKIRRTGNRILFDFDPFGKDIVVKIK